MSKKSISETAFPCGRRKFLAIGALTGAGLVLPGKWIGSALALNQSSTKARKLVVPKFNQSPTNIRKFVVALPGLGPTGIPVAAPNTTKFNGMDYYEIQAAQFTQQLHPDLAGPTTLWGYADVTDGKAANYRYLGGLIVAQQNRPVRIKAINKLPATHPLPVDMTPPYMMGRTTVNRISIHLHGGFNPWMSDGMPMADFDPSVADGGTGYYGASALGAGGIPLNIPDMDQPTGGFFNYHYPNQDRAKLEWYHDHAIGITRLNAYAGLATGYVLQDPVEHALMDNRLIPGMAQMVPLIIQDKSFQADGSLWYPSVYEKNSQLPDGSGRWDWGPDVIPPATGVTPPPALSGIPEFFADTALVNGAPYPYLQVEQRHYRFRILNGSQARFFNLQLYYASETNSNEIDLKPHGKLDRSKVVLGPPMIQIGTEGGFLPAPVALNTKIGELTFDPESENPTSYNLLLAPAERADVIIDFSNVPTGAKLILYSDAPAPFPSGDERNDYWTGAPDQSAFGGAPTPLAGYGPNSRTLMQFQVIPRVGPADPSSMSIMEKVALGTLPASSNPLPALTKLTTVGAVVRNLTLNEDFDEYGRLIQKVGTNVQNGLNNQGMPTWGRDYESAATEVISAGAKEVWRIYNLTGDTHPMHWHLVNLQILSRQPFDPEHFPTVKYTGPARAPDANERGWKETIRCQPMECITVIAKFDLPNPGFIVPASARTGGSEYVWHCHILEHEEHDMMRPMIVV